jgi:AcrR family transcriptional regulator
MATPSQKRSARQQILDIAVRLFYEHGYHSVGIDRIIAESGVAKMSLYRHFPSKDALIAAALDQMNTQFWHWIDGETGGASSPREKLIAIFHAVEKVATSYKCLGCAFQAAAADFPDFEHLNHKAALAHKEQVVNRLTELAHDAGLLKPRQLAQQLLLLMDGAWASARMYGTRGPAREVAAAAQALVDAHTRENNCC